MSFFLYLGTLYTPRKSDSKAPQVSIDFPQGVSIFSRSAIPVNKVQSPTPATTVHVPSTAYQTLSSRFEIPALPGETFSDIVVLMTLTISGYGCVNDKNESHNNPGFVNAVSIVGAKQVKTRIDHDILRSLSARDKSSSGSQ